MVDDRPAITVQAAPGGWPSPWPNVAEIEAVLPPEHWTLIGGLMVQLHAIHHQIDAIRPTNDVDLIVHVESGEGRPSIVAAALESLDYQLSASIDPRNNTAHRFRRGRSTIDLVTGNDVHEIVDVVVADHAAPRALSPLRGHAMVQVEGGTQALRRTLNATLTIVPSTTTVISVPDPFGALILKSAAHKADSRRPERHLADAALLLACIADPIAERERDSYGSDRSRILHLAKYLDDPLHSAWARLPSSAREEARNALRLLCA